MPINNYCVIDANDSDRVIENIIVIDDSDVSSYEEENGKILVLSTECAFSGVGNQYINGYFQPFDPEEIPSSWTKDSDGVWNAVKTMTNDPNEFWNPIDNEWVILDPESEEFATLLSQVKEL